MKIPDRIYKNKNSEIIKETLFFHFLNETIALIKLKHTNIVKLFQICEIKNEQKAFLLLEYVSNENLLTWKSSEYVFQINKKNELSQTEYFKRLGKVLFELSAVVKYCKIIRSSKRNLSWRY